MDISDRASACPKCGAPIQPIVQMTTRIGPTQGSRLSSQGSNLRPVLLWLGSIMLAIGAVSLTVAFAMDVTAPGSSMVNFDLMQKRQLGVIIGLVVGALGFLSLLETYLRLPSPSGRVDPWTIRQLAAALTLIVIAAAVIVRIEAHARFQRHQAELLRLLQE